MDTGLDLVLLVFGSVDVHDEQVAGFELVEVVELDNTVKVGCEDRSLSLFGDVDEKGEVKAEIVGEEGVPFHEVVDHL